MHRKSAEDKQSVREDCAATFGDSPKIYAMLLA
jgi:hypothetical protein